MGTLGHQGIFVISIYFFLLILAHFRLPAFQANIMADYKERQAELKARKGKLKEWEAKLRKRKKFLHLRKESQQKEKRVEEKLKKEEDKLKIPFSNFVKNKVSECFYSSYIF